jgi:hypothetical protein
VSVQNALPVGESPTESLCLYELAMRLRASADGSGDPMPEHAVQEARSYLEERLRKWGPDRCESEAHFRAFLVSLHKETAQREEKP